MFGASWPFACPRGASTLPTHTVLPCPTVPSSPWRSASSKGAGASWRRGCWAGPLGSSHCCRAERPSPHGLRGLDWLPPGAPPLRSRAHEGNSFRGCSSATQLRRHGRWVLCDPVAAALAHPLLPPDFHARGVPAVGTGVVPRPPPVACAHPHSGKTPQGTSGGLWSDSKSVTCLQGFQTNGPERSDSACLPSRRNV